MPRIFVLLALVATSAVALADVPLVIEQQGRLLDGSDQPVNGSVQIKATIFAEPVAPGSNPETALWTETYDVTVTSGMYDIALGDPYAGTRKALDATLFQGTGDRYLELAVNGTTLSPRLHLTSVPFAFDASNFGGEPPAFYATQAALDATNADLTQAKADLSQAVTDEATARTTAIDDATTALQGDLGDAKVSLQAAIDAETQARSTAIANEASARTTADQAESQARATAIADEASARSAADAQKLDLTGGTLSGALTATSFSGSGAGLTNVPSSSLTGTIADAQIPQTAKLAATNAFTGATNSFSGNVGIGTSTPGTTMNQNPSWPSYAPDARVLTVEDGAHPPAIELAGAPQNAGDQIGGLWFTNLGGQSDAHLQVAGIVAERAPYAGATNIVGGRLDFVTKVSGSGELNHLVFDQAGDLGIGTTTPGARLEVIGDFIRTIARWQGYAADNTDSGQLAGRRLTFTKRDADTGLRVTWSDNFRVTINNEACRWEVLFNGASCTNPGGLVLDKYEGNTSSNRHDPSTFVGTCFGLPAGAIQVTTRVGSEPGYSGADCYTGWNNQLASLEVEEVR